MVFDLIEKTNREGFVENGAYEAFKNSILHTLEIIEILRYSDKQKLREIYGHSVRRGELATKTLLALYNNQIRKAFPFLPEKEIQDIY